MALQQANLGALKGLRPCRLSAKIEPGSAD